LSVAAGMAVMRAMFDAEITAACGPKGKHQPDCKVSGSWLGAGSRPGWAGFGFGRRRCVVGFG
jgi:hypothetical protein